MHEKELQEPPEPEHTSEHVKSQNFLGACPQTPLTQSILWGSTFCICPAPPIFSAALCVPVELCYCPHCFTLLLLTFRFLPFVCFNFNNFNRTVQAKQNVPNFSVGVLIGSCVTTLIEAAHTPPSLTRVRL